MQQKDRLMILGAIIVEKPHLQTIHSPGVINETWFTFIARTDPKGTAAKIKQFIDETDPQFYKRVIPLSTVEKDRRRPIEGNKQGLNKTWEQITQRKSDETAVNADGITGYF